MTSQQIMQADLLDILFENRNKSYGAYLLRKTYPKELAKAIGITIFLALLLLFFIRPADTEARVQSAGPEVIVSQIDMPKPLEKVEPPKPIDQPRPQVQQTAFLDFKLVNKEIVPDVAAIDELENTAISDRTTPGEDVSTMQPVIEAPKGNGDAPAKAAEEPKKEIAPDKQPQFPGGVEAWLAFLNRNLMSPEELESGEKKTVVIRFQVAEDGTITNFNVVRSAGRPFDNEVIRVLKKMPRWSPAMQGGHPVSVSFSQPVTFVGVEQ